MSEARNLTQRHIENRIFTIRGHQVMIDRDLAEMYQVEVKRLNEQVKRNAERFPQSFRFQLNDDEKQELVANCDRFETLKHASTNPFAFTEQGVAMLSAVLRSETAIKVSVQIITAFVEMRKTLAAFGGLLQRIEGLERKQIESDQRFEHVFKALERKEHIPSEGVFFDGQVFEAYELASKIIRSASKSIVLIDNYINENTLTHLAKKADGVAVLLLSQTLSEALQLDVQKANAQYGGFTAKRFHLSHDRFLIIDGREVYHLGASLKDLGKRWFAFSKLEATSVEHIMNSISKVI